MTTRSWIVYVLLALYVFVISVLTIYHAYHFTDYTHVKGDETINYMYFLLLTSILFQIAVSILLKYFNWKAVALSTIGNFIGSTIIVFFILSSLDIAGIPRHLIFIYGCCYVTVFVIVIIVQLKRFRTSAQQQG